VLDGALVISELLYIWTEPIVIVLLARVNDLTDYEFIKPP